MPEAAATAVPACARSRPRWVVGFWSGVFALNLALVGLAIYGQSLTGDGAYHLIAGHQALRYGQNLVNLEHPPLVKMVAALPLWLENAPLAPPIRVEDALATIPRIHAQPQLLWRATVRGRWLLLVCFSLPFLVVCWLLGRRFGGPEAGFVLAAMVGLTFWVLPNLVILQTDTAAGLAFGATLLAAIGYAEKPVLVRAIGLGSAAGLALAVKFSGVLLGPTVLLSFLLARETRSRWRARAAHLVVAGLVSFALPYTSYVAANRSYASDAGRDTLRSYCRNQGTLVVDDTMRGLEEPLLALEGFDPFVAQWAVGFLGVRAQNAIGVYPSYALGEVYSKGRWWYFPLVFLAKTPLVLLCTGLAALGWKLVHRRGPSLLGGRGWILAAVTVGIYLATAITSNYNLGIRHLLPILPLLYLPLAIWLAGRPWVGKAVVTVLAIEALLLCPLWLSATNTWWLGERNPTRFSFSWGDLEYRQNFVQLARATDARGIRSLKVLYPLLGEEVVRAYLPDARLVEPEDPLEPGWYAVNVIVEQFVPGILRASSDDLYGYDGLYRLAQRWLPFWREVAAGRDAGYVAGTFHLYELTELPGATP
ncbi:MAG: glycosyltransferase family 39 protein [Thermoanaerobaculia bacterium]|nr:glycosyltransferase family 39 protein [Thermoanaerobaculia bacterium]